MLILQETHLVSLFMRAYVDDTALNQITDHIDPSSPTYLPEFMPKLKQLIIDRGLTFNNFYVTEALCCPSRATILRGQYPHNTGIVNNSGSLSGGFQGFYERGHENSTIAKWLQDSGYKTALFGKYLNNYPESTPVSPTYVPPGWTEWYGVAGSVSYYGYRLIENGVSVYYGNKESDYQTDKLSEKAVDFINRTGDQSFFAYISPPTSHAFAKPAKRHLSLFPELSGRRSPSFNESDISDKPYVIGSLPPLDESYISTMDQHYKDSTLSLMAVDDMIESLVNALIANNKFDNTYIFISSDNGFHFGEHRLPEGKSYAYEEDVHQPLYVVGPGVPFGQRNELVINNDFAPTWAEIAGIPGPSDYIMDGRSILPLLSDKPLTGWRMAILITSPGLSGVASYRGLRVRDQENDSFYVEWHYNGVSPSNYNREFYNLTSDPHQLDNLYNLTNPDTISKYSGKIAALRTCTGLSCVAAENDPASGIQVTINSATSTVEVSKHLNFTATVIGTANTEVEWKTEYAIGGSIDNSGLYVAPQVPGKYRVIAISKADPGVQAVVIVNVTNTTSNGSLISKVILYPKSVPGGTITTQNVISLNSPAPIGGTVVNLSSSDPIHASVPSSITIPEGLMSNNFSINVSPVAVQSKPTISAEYGGITKSSVLTIQPPNVKFMTATPRTVKGGLTAVLEVNLSSVVSENQPNVTIAVSNPELVTAPAYITFAPGQLSATTTLATTPVSTDTTTTVTATYGASQKTINLYLKP